MKTKKPKYVRGSKRVSALIRLPEEIMAQLDVEAERAGVSRNQLVTQLVWELVEGANRMEALIAKLDDDPEANEVLARAKQYAFGKGWPKPGIQRLLFFLGMLSEEVK